MSNSHRIGSDQTHQTHIGSGQIRLTKLTLKILARNELTKLTSDQSRSDSPNSQAIYNGADFGSLERANSHENRVTERGGEPLSPHQRGDQETPCELREFVFTLKEDQKRVQYIGTYSTIKGPGQTHLTHQTHALSSPGDLPPSPEHYISDAGGVSPAPLYSRDPSHPQDAGRILLPVQRRAPLCVAGVTREAVA